MSNKKTVLICGYGDLGKAVAKKLSENGFTIAVISRTSVQESDYNFFQGDITEFALTAKVIKEIADKFGGIDACVFTSTSEIQRRHVFDLSVEEFKKDFETTVFGGFNFLNTVAKEMKNRKAGAIVAITTSAIEQNAAHGKMGGYLSAKYALRGLLRQLAEELVSAVVTVNAVAPGFMRTKLNKDVPERMDDFLKEKNPMKRIVTPEEVAGVVMFLCSDAAKYLTGLSIPVTSGETFQL